MINFDKIIYKNKQRDTLKNRVKHTVTWGPQTFRLMIAAPSGGGKTNLTLNLILKFLKYEQVHILCKTPEEPAYSYLKEFFDEIEEETGKKVLYVYRTIKDMPEVDSLDDNSHKLIVIDDFVKESDDPKITNYFLFGRKKRCGVIFLTQSYFSVPPIIRRNCNYFAIFKLASAFEKESFKREICSELSSGQFNKIYNKSVVEHGDFLFIDLKTTPHDKISKYRKNMLYNIEIPEK